LQRFQKTYGDKGFIALSIGNLYTVKSAEKYVVQQALRGETPVFPVLLKGWQIYKQYGGKGTPNTFIVDRNGRVRFIHRDFQSGLEKLMEREIKALLEEGV
jgi:hypothetical protein